MKKTQRDQMIDIISSMTATEQSNLRATLAKWIDNHDKKKNSWFWSDNGSSGMRKSKEKYYTFTESVTIGSAVIVYTSDCQMSRKNVYWTDGLSVQDSDMKINFGDIALFLDAVSIQES